MTSTEIRPMRMRKPKVVFSPSDNGAAGAEKEQSQNKRRRIHRPPSMGLSSPPANSPPAARNTIRINRSGRAPRILAVVDSVESNDDSDL